MLHDIYPLLIEQSVHPVEHLTQSGPLKLLLDAYPLLQVMASQVNAVEQLQ